MCHCVALWVVALFSPSIESATARIVTEESVQAARDHLEHEINRAREDSTYLQRMLYREGVTDFSALSLGEPWAEYLLTSQAIGDFADSKVTEFGEGARLLNWAFPVFYEANYIGRLHVRYHNGAWGVGGMTLAKSSCGPPLIHFVSRVRKDYPPEAGYRVAVLIAGQMGTYALLYANGKLSKIAQVYPDPYGVLGFPMDKDGFGLLLPIEEARDKLLTLARRYREPSYGRDTVKEE
jgi:hypothetical protein